MNEEAHWNTMAASYEDQIFDVFKSDKRKKLPVYFEKYADQAHHAIDFGCGIGKAFPYLSPLFGEILAIDISAKCLSLAKSRAFSNIAFKRVDLTKPGLRLPKTDFAFCCNVVMLPEIEKNEAMLRNIYKSLKKGGHAVLVLPSLESILYSSWRLIDWYRKEGVKPEKIPASEFNYFKGSKRDLLQGIVEISGVPTKHFSEPEIRILIKSAGLSVVSIDHLEYDWDTEFSSPPKWMQEPYPYDWLVECKRID
jgi:SAM-dependent methyltransferase